MAVAPVVARISPAEVEVVAVKVFGPLIVRLPIHRRSVADAGTFEPIDGDPELPVVDFETPPPIVFGASSSARSNSNMRSAYERHVAPPVCVSVNVVVARTWFALLQSQIDEEHVALCASVMSVYVLPAESVSVPTVRFVEFDAIERTMTMHPGAAEVAVSPAAIVVGLVVAGLPEMNEVV